MPTVSNYTFECKYFDKKYYHQCGKIIYVLNTMRILSYIFFISLILFSSSGACRENTLEIDTPLKASVLYFPTPATMRCLNHSNIPKTFRKAVVQRQVKFPNEEILKSPEAISHRKHELSRAMLLGNNYKGKVKIIFEDDECIKQVETTVWSFTTKWIILKKGLLIPIQRVYEIKI